MPDRTAGDAPNPFHRDIGSFDASAGIGTETMRAAARGDLTAQRRARDAVIADTNGFMIANPIALILGVELVPYARICAAQGNSDDARTLAGALYFTYEASRQAGFGDGAECLAGEALAILEPLAAAGDEVAALASVQIATIHPSAADIARRLIKGN